MIPKISRRKFSTFLLMSLLWAACSTSPSPAPPPVNQREAVLLRTYWLLLGPETKMGKSHPPVDSFVFQGTMAGGQDGKAQLEALKNQLTLPDLGFQFSDSATVAQGQPATLQMGFGDLIQIQVMDLLTVEGGTLSTDVSIHFGSKEVLRQRISFKPAEALIFAGRLDTQLPTLSVFSLEPRLYPAEKQAELDDFLQQSTRDRAAFTPPPPKQKDQEPYLPGIGDVTMPELISSVKAPYPEAAKAQKLEGQVIVEIVVNRKGEATNPRVITPPSIFDYDAIESAKTYRYRPATKNGQPVSVTMNIIQVFQLAAKTPP